MTPAESEAARIRAEYERREREIGREFYALTDPANLFIRQGQQRALQRALLRSHRIPLTDQRILEVGCGRGQWLATFEEFGARREHLAGIDLAADRLADAAKRFPGADLREGDATALPWPAASFDLVFQSTVFTSILDDAVRRAVVAEMRRVLRPDGLVVWYDFRYDNPNNANVRGIGARELQALFPDAVIELESATLAPPLARRIAPRAWLIAAALERLRLLNTHLIATIRWEPHACE